MSDYVVKAFQDEEINHGDAVHYDPDKKIVGADIGYEGVAPDTLDDRFNFSSDGSVSGPVSSTDNAIARFNSTSGNTLLNSTVILDDDGNLAAVNSMALDISPTSPPTSEGAVSWNSDDQTIDVHTKWGTTLQVGQEDIVIFYNDTGVEIPDGTPVYPVGGGPGGRPSMAPAKADIHSNFGGELLITTAAVPNGQEGPATRFGKVRGIDTSLLSVGTIWLSDTVAGGYTNTKPTFPGYAVQIGGVIVSDDTIGEILLAIKGDANDTVLNFWNGVFRESFDFLITESGGVVTGTLTPSDGHPNMTMIFSDGFTILDTDPGATIALTVGTDTIPQTNYVYILKSAKVLAVSTSDWPAAEHIKVCQCLLQSATGVNTNGALRNQNWNDHIQGTMTSQGHVSHICEKLRQFEAQWDSGIEGTCTIVDTLPDDVYVSCTSGVVYQMHKQIFSALDTQTTDDVHIVNHNTTPYTTAQNLNGQTTDASGNTLANRSFSFVLWGVQNKTGEISHLMLNLPSNSYLKNVPDSAVSDANNYSVYTIPKIFQGVGFLIARFTYQLEPGGTNWTLYDTEDLRGKVPNITAGGGAGGTGVTDFTALLDTPSSYTGQSGKVIKVNSGETAVEFDAEITHVLQGDPTTALSTGDGKLYFTVPESLDGYNLISAHACVYTVSSSGAPSIQVHNRTDAVDMLSVSITIDVSELNSYTATTPHTVDTSNDDVSTGDVICIDVDVAGTGVEGLDIHLVFNKP